MLVVFYMALCGKELAIYMGVGLKVKHLQKVHQLQNDCALIFSTALRLLCRCTAVENPIVEELEACRQLFIFSYSEGNKLVGV